nr:glycosyltransferase [Ancylobacter lacus]
MFPEASYGAALNCVGIAQELRRAGAEPVFICHPGFGGIFAEYGFTEYQLADGRPEAATDWNDFIERHKDAFAQSALDQIDSYVAPTWEAIVDTAIRAEEPLRQLIARLKPDVIVLDNVVMFPAVATAGVPWVRVVSCAETEVPDPRIPPYLSGAPSGDPAAWEAFAARYDRAVAPAHRRLSAFLADCGLRPGPGFLEPSPHLNLLLAPTIIRHERARKLDPRRFVFLEGCVRREAPYTVPRFASHNDAPLALTSFGSLGAMDVGMIRRMIGVFAGIPARFLVNAGHWREEYSQVPDNVLVDSWFPQPSVVAQADLFIHHGGNNSFCEALYFGVPSLVMPYCWDGHDNATRAQEAGVGRRLDRYRWREEELADAIGGLLGDRAMRARLSANAAIMQAAGGAARAAAEILKLVVPRAATRRPKPERTA